MFLFSVFWWWWEFRLGAIQVWTFGVYLFVILYAFVVFLMCALLFPGNFTYYDGFRGYIYAKRRGFFGVLCFSSFVDLGDAVIKGMDYFDYLGTQYVIATVATIVLSAIAMFSRNQTFHAVFVVTAVAYSIISGFLLYDTVG